MNNDNDVNELVLPLTSGVTSVLRAGDMLRLSGEILLARDAAHKIIYEMLVAGEALPCSLAGATIYYCGPTPAPPGKIIGSAGPTTSSRMDFYTPELLKAGLLGMIGKGARNESVSAAIKEYGAVYFAALGGAGALLSKCFVSVETVAFEHLGTEALRRATVRDFPVTVAIDARGGSIFL